MSVKARSRLRPVNCWRTRHEEAALQLYREHFKGTAATPADAYVFVGKLYLFMGNTEDGLRSLHHALELQPTVRGAHTYEGILALKLGDLGRAEKEFKAELANDPNYQLAIAEMGEVRYHQGDWPDAAEYLAKSRTTTPELLYMLCDAYFHIEKVSDANLTAETVAAYGRNNPELMKTAQRASPPQRANGTRAAFVRQARSLTS